MVAPPSRSRRFAIAIEGLSSKVAGRRTRGPSNPCRGLDRVPLTRPLTPRASALSSSSSPRPQRLTLYHLWIISVECYRSCNHVGIRTPMEPGQPARRPPLGVRLRAKAPISSSLSLSISAFLPRRPPPPRPSSSFSSCRPSPASPPRPPLRPSSSFSCPSPLWPPWLRPRSS